MYKIWNYSGCSGFNFVVTLASCEVTYESEDVLFQTDSEEELNNWLENN